MPHHKRMIPDTFAPPERVTTDRFVVRTLMASDAVADFEAFSTSIEHLQGVFGPDSTWPRAGMTLEDNMLDLAWHQREHESASCFGFTVFDLTNTTCLGCIYFSPARKAPYEVEAFYWVRASEVAKGLDEALGSFVKQWVKDAWPFKSVIYPGRDIAWDEWSALPDHPRW